jgi:acyl dehydratase
VHELPTRAPDHASIATQPAGMALIYRLSGDYNPLHAEPAVARAAGFERPDPARPGHLWHRRLGVDAKPSAARRSQAHLQSIDVRFSSPVYPGRDDTHRNLGRRQASCRSAPAPSNATVVVLNNGRAELR